ncbi:hypothetical protein MNB_SV-5-609 [hydrothermal vent metagenome]|uniref:Thioredoxin-like fold domain-containing protein n=1 Tax=hydrothermal vent metagenome TaxID=652676 RepID=A0A1W1EC90_9ZZZZ
MKKLFTIVVLLTAILNADIVWQKDIVTAFELAKKENKTVMVFVESENCRWCKKMKKNTLSDEKVIKSVNSFISVKVFRENQEAVKQLPNIQGVPTVFFMSADKKIIETSIGYYSVEDFLSYINDVKKKTKL